MHENNFVSGHVESPVARRNRAAWHNLSDERQRRRDEEDDALDDGRSWPGGRSALGETNGRGRAPTRASAKRQGGSRGTAFCAAVTTADRPRQSRRRTSCVSDGRDPGRRGTTLAPLGNTLLPPLVSPRAKIATFRRLAPIQIISRCGPSKYLKMWPLKISQDVAPRISRCGPSKYLKMWPLVPMFFNTRLK